MASRASRYVAAGPASVDRRDTRRLPVQITDATIRHHAAEAVAATLGDLSAYGCRLQSVGGHRAGDRIWLRLAGGLPIAATVVWSADGVVGCRFDQSLARDMVKALALRAN